jgi:hypothetical protein
MSKPPLMFKPRIVEAAARKHPDWNVLPDGKLQRRKGNPGPDTPEELEAWFVENYPDEVTRLQAEAEKLERKMFGDTQH